MGDTMAYGNLPQQQQNWGGNMYGQNQYNPNQYNPNQFQGGNQYQNPYQGGNQYPASNQYSGSNQFQNQQQPSWGIKPPSNQWGYGQNQNFQGPRNY